MPTIPPAGATNSASKPKDPPISHFIAVRMGMTHEDISRGIADGTILPPVEVPGSKLPIFNYSKPPGAGVPTTPALTSTQGNPPATTPPNGAKPIISTPLPSSIVPSTSVTPVAESASADATMELDRARVTAWIIKLDETATTDIWEQVGQTDAARSQHLFSFLRRALLNDSASLPAEDAADYATILTQKITEMDAYLAAPGHQAKLVNLRGKDGATLLALAKTDMGYRYALQNLDGIALTGNKGIFEAQNQNGELNRFDAETGERNISDAFLADRAKMLAWKLKLGDELADTISGDANWTYTDKTIQDADGKNLQIKLYSEKVSALTHQVIFGDNETDGEIITGGTGTDRIYGSSGADILRGNSGNDYLEGNSDNDLLLGGAGADQLLGGAGQDELEGGTGNDELKGNSGEDTLTGGRGDDRLEGGADFDTYVLDSGDGKDVIIDSDGAGEIIFNGEALTGGQASTNGEFKSLDGQVSFSFAGDKEEGGTLSITSGDDTSTIKNWKNGDLGITLGAGDAAALTKQVDPLIALIDNGGWFEYDSTSDFGFSGNKPRNDTPLPTSTSDATPETASQAELLDDFFAAPAVPEAVTPERLNAALKSHASVAIAPDITNASTNSNAMVGLTPQDISQALMDFHDANTEAADLGNELIGATSRNQTALIPSQPDLSAGLKPSASVDIGSAKGFKGVD